MPLKRHHETYKKLFESFERLILKPTRECWGSDPGGADATCRMGAFPCSAASWRAASKLSAGCPS